MQRPWLAVLAVAAALCACGQPVDGTPVAGVPGLEDQFDPCTIPDQAIQATGLDPGSKRVGFGEGTSVAEWKRCTWAGPVGDEWYYFDIYVSSIYTLDDVRTNPNYSDLTDVAVASREAVRFKYGSADLGTRCDAAFETDEGLARLSLEAMGGLSPVDRPCERLMRHLVDLEPNFP